LFAEGSLTFCARSSMVLTFWLSRLQELLWKYCDTISKPPHYLLNDLFTGVFLEVDPEKSRTYLVTFRTLLACILGIN
jgi:hypothetical protein